MATTNTDTTDKTSIDNALALVRAYAEAGHSITVNIHGVPFEDFQEDAKVVPTSVTVMAVPANKASYLNGKFAFDQIVVTAFSLKLPVQA